MKAYTVITSALLCMLLAAGCTPKYSNTIPDWPWPDPEEASTEWTDVSSDYGTLPEYVKIFKAPETLQGTKAIAFIADVDLSKQTFSVWGLNAPTLEGSTEALQTPKQIYDSKGKPSVVINAGFFYSDGGKNYSASLEVSEGTLLSPNINYASEDWVSVYYPTRAVFLQHSDGTYEAAWSYWKSESEHYVYQTPAKNSWAATPLKAPDATFPSEGASFEAVNGIGGGPVLLKGGTVMNTYRDELFDGSGGILCDAQHPRTAIGVTADKHLVLFVCEGRNMTEGVPGLTTEEVANVLKDYGCVDAINLDGGGSTLMLVNGTELIKPSDGKERSVGSCVYIK